MIAQQIEERMKELDREAEEHKQALMKIKDEKACLMAFQRTAKRLKKKTPKP